MQYRVQNLAWNILGSVNGQFLYTCNPHSSFRSSIFPVTICDTFTTFEYTMQPADQCVELTLLFTAMKEKGETYSSKNC